MKAQKNTWTPQQKKEYEKNKAIKMELIETIDALYPKSLWGFDWLEHLEKLEFEKSAIEGHLKAWLESMF